MTRFVKIEGPFQTIHNRSKRTPEYTKGKAESHRKLQVTNDPLGTKIVFREKLINTKTKFYTSDD